MFVTGCERVLELLDQHRQQGITGGAAEQFRNHSMSVAVDRGPPRTERSSFRTLRGIDRRGTRIHFAPGWTAPIL